MTLEQWTVAGRGFGGLLVFLLLAGEIYTTFTFLGGSGWAYGRGAPTYYILAYGSLAYILSYWLLPPIWRYAKQERLVSQSHFFSRKYDSPWARARSSRWSAWWRWCPICVLQFQGLGIIVSVSLLRLHLVDRRDLDRRGDGDDLRDGLRHARRGVERDR